MSLVIAKELLVSGGYTCVLTDGTSLFTSRLRGVKPLVQFLEQKNIPKNLFAADKVVGRATAYLYVRLGVQALHATIISQPAIEVLQSHGIAFSYETLVPNIINRKGDGICPFEEAVMGINNPETAYEAILKKMDTIQIKLWD